MYRHATPLGAESLRQRRERAVERDALAAVRRGRFEDPHLAMGRRAAAASSRARHVAAGGGRRRRAGGGGRPRWRALLRVLRRCHPAVQHIDLRGQNAGLRHVPKVLRAEALCMRRKFVQRFAFSVRADARGNLFTRWCGFRSANRPCTGPRTEDVPLAVVVGAVEAVVAQDHWRMFELLHSAGEEGGVSGPRRRAGRDARGGRREAHLRELWYASCASGNGGSATGRGTETSACFRTLALSKRTSLAAASDISKVSQQEFLQSAPWRTGTVGIQL